MSSVNQDARSLLLLHIRCKCSVKGNVVQCNALISVLFYKSIPLPLDIDDRGKKTLALV